MNRHVFALLLDNIPYVSARISYQWHVHQCMVDYILSDQWKLLIPSSINPCLSTCLAILWSTFPAAFYFSFPSFAAIIRYVCSCFFLHPMKIEMLTYIRLELANQRSFIYIYIYIYIYAGVFFCSTSIISIMDFVFGINNHHHRSYFTFDVCVKLVWPFYKILRI
jgi:hypothetical protein